MILFESTQQNKNKIQNNNAVYQKKNKVFIDAGYLIVGSVYAGSV